MSEITLFAKKRITKDGKTFYTYMSTITRKDGTEQKVEVKFQESCGKPDGAKCPMNIIIDKEHCSMSKHEVTSKRTGEIVTVYKMWVSQWSDGSTYVDHSMDEFNV